MVFDIDVEARGCKQEHYFCAPVLDLLLVLARVVAVFRFDVAFSPSGEKRYVYQGTAHKIHRGISPEVLRVRVCTIREEEPYVINIIADDSPPTKKNPVRFTESVV